LSSAHLAAGAAIFATPTLAAPAQTAVIDSRFDICAALRDGTSLAAIETTLEAQGYTGGVLTGTTIRQHCPDQATNAMAQAQIASRSHHRLAPVRDGLPGRGACWATPIRDKFCLTLPRWP
jgi:hypothetical protein